MILSLYNYNVSIIPDALVITTPWFFSFSPSDVSSYRLYMGRYQLDGANQFETAREAKRVVVAQGFSTPQEGSDVALVELSSPLTWTSHIQPVCLPNFDFQFYSGTMCYVTGWGDTQEGGECRKKWSTEQVQRSALYLKDVTLQDDPPS